MGNASAQAAAAGKQYALRGKVVAANEKTGEVTVDHEAIPGLMAAMSMPYRAKDPAVLSELHPGDQITATLTLDGDEAYLDHFVVIALAKPDYKPAVIYHVPTAGEVVPDFKFLNQSGKTIHLGAFRGDVIFLTFVYTRCTLSDYCPRMSRNFAIIDQKLAADPKLYARTHLLSVSFDPAYDTAAVLRSYGGAYTGRYTEEDFAHWDFAAPSQVDLAKIEKWFGVGVTPGGDNSLTHSLSTVVIGPDGKLLGWYPSNEWNPDQLVAQAKAAIE